MPGVRRSAVIVFSTIFFAGSTLCQSFGFVPITGGGGLIRAHNGRQKTTRQYGAPQQQVSEARGMTMLFRKGRAGEPSIQKLVANYNRQLPPIPTEANKVMVSKLDESWSEDDVREFGSQAGNVVSVKLISRNNARRGKRRGFAFIEYDEDIASTAVRALRYMSIHGKVVETKPAYKDTKEEMAAYLKWEAEHPEKVAEAMHVFMSSSKQSIVKQRRAEKKTAMPQ